MKDKQGKNLHFLMIRAKKSALITFLPITMKGFRILLINTITIGKLERSRNLWFTFKYV
jgi:hypothetical protein